VFDRVKLSWMNGQHLRALPEDDLTARIAASLADAGLLSDAGSPFAAAVAGLVKGSVELLTDAGAQAAPLWGYPFAETAASEEFKPVGGPGLFFGGEGPWGGCRGGGRAGGRGDLGAWPGGQGAPPARAAARGL
jgi:hypothetical protein